MADERRTAVVTGSASGIGAATRALLESHGVRVIGIDLRDADIECDLATAAGRAAMVEGVEQASGGKVDAVIANAGIGPVGDLTVRVNYFGAVATLVGLRHLLLQAPAPRAVAASSIRSLARPDTELAAACRDHDEPRAAARADELMASGDRRDAGRLYGTTKHALNEWLRRQATTPDWAGAGIPLNAVAPGLVRTASTEPLLRDDPDYVANASPAPLGGIPGDPLEVAHAIAWLAGPHNTRITAQVIYVDGGAHQFLARAD